MSTSRSKRLLLLLPFVSCLGAALALSCGGDDTGASPPQDGGATNDATAGPDALPDHVRVPYDAGGQPAVPRVPVVAQLVQSRIDATGLLFAAGEMQISGEPFAQFFAGRNLNNYDRTLTTPDLYNIPTADGGIEAVVDLFGYSTAVESYEYSKYHMNNVVQETGAGISLANGPLVARAPGATLQDKLVARVGDLLTSAGTDVGGYALLPPPQNNPMNILGFAGLAPVFAPFASWDPAMAVPVQVVASCNRAGGYGGIPSVGMVTPEYECEYNQMNLPDAQLEHALSPSTLGYATWKEALWAIDFAGRLHDSASNPVNAVADSDRALVGGKGNMVVGTDPAGAAPGTYLGSTPLEGMWGFVMIEAMDNLAEMLLTRLTTADGKALGGFATKNDALSYDYASPLRWFPAGVGVTVDTTQHFPTLTGLSLSDGTSRADDLSALLLGNATFFAMTDARNTEIGQRIGLQLAFDGTPFPPDDGTPNGEETAHDRSLGVLRVAFVDLDRMHMDPTLGVALDTATVSGATVTRGSALTTTSVGHVVVGLTQLLLSINASVTQYGGANPDPSADMNGILNAIPINPPEDAGAPTSFSARVRRVLVENATFVREKLTTVDGAVVNGGSVAGGAFTADASPATIESQAAALRALGEGFLITGDESFRVRARAVAKRLFAQFWSAPALMFRGVEGGKDEIHMTAARFAWLQSALRETHKVLFVQDDPVLGRDALERVIARVNKLYLNGWDDLNGDGHVDHGDPGGPPNECLAARMQGAEQALTGELGIDDFARPAEDRDHDCVKELAHAQTASVLAGEVLFHSP